MNLPHLFILKSILHVLLFLSLILHSLLCLLLLFEHNEFTQLILNFLLGIDFFYLIIFLPRFILTNLP